MKILFVINPKAGKKDKSGEMKAEIKKFAPGADIYLTEAPKSATAYVKNYINSNTYEDIIKIFACGGDGTLSEVTEGVYSSGAANVALGVVPIGSGNDFVKSFDINIEDFRSVEKQINGDIIPTDILKISDEEGKERVSVNIVSAGFDAAVAKGMDKFKKIPLVSGSFAYDLSLIQCVFTKRKNYFDIYFDNEKIGDRETPYLFAIGANGRYYGGGFKAAPYAVTDDGLMDMIRIDSVGIFKFLSLVGKFRAGRHIEEAKDIVLHKLGKNLKFISDGYVDTNVDGEIIPMKNPEITVLSKAINIILPR